MVECLKNTCYHIDQVQLWNSIQRVINDWNKCRVITRAHRTTMHYAHVSECFISHVIRKILCTIVLCLMVGGEMNQTKLKKKVKKENYCKKKNRASTVIYLNIRSCCRMNHINSICSKIQEELQQSILYNET